MTCMSKRSGLYFSEDQRNLPCQPPMTPLPAFWSWHPSGNLDAEICQSHAEIALRWRGKGYLKERITEATYGA